MTLRRMRLRRKTDPKTGKHTFCEPAHAKCTWTFHKSHFVWKFRGKMPDAYENTSIKHRALTLPVRTLSVWPHCLGNFPYSHGKPHISLCLPAKLPSKPRWSAFLRRGHLLVTSEKGPKKHGVLVHLTRNGSLTSHHHGKYGDINIIRMLRGESV